VADGDVWAPPHGSPAQREATRCRAPAHARRGRCFGARYASRTDPFRTNKEKELDTALARVHIKSWRRTGDRSLSGSILKLITAFGVTAAIMDPRRRRFRHGILLHATSRDRRTFCVPLVASTKRPRRRGRHLHGDVTPALLRRWQPLRAFPMQSGSAKPSGVLQLRGAFRPDRFHEVHAGSRACPQSSYRQAHR